MSSNIEIEGIAKRVSKKRSIYDTLLGQIQSHALPLGARVPSASALAEQFDVSYVTMHAALNELTRDGWLTRHPKNGTFVAEPKKKVVKNTITFFLPVRQDIVMSGNAVKTFEIVTGATDRAAELGWEINIRSLPSYPQKDESLKYLDTLNDQAGAIFIGAQYQELIDTLSREKFPVVVVDGKHAQADLVTYSRPKAIALAVEHFLKMDYKRIGYFGHLSDPQGKQEHFFKLLKQKGISVAPHATQHCQSITSVESCCQTFLADGPPCEALFIDNYEIAAAFAQHARESGIRLPDEIKIVALGDEHGASPLAKLSYVKIPYFEFGQEAVTLLQEQLPPTSRATQRTRSLPVELILR